MGINRLAACAALAAAGLLAGCGGGGNGGGAAHTAQSDSAVRPRGLTATLTEDRASVAVGGTVTYTLTLKNDTAHAITYNASQSCNIQSERAGASITVIGPSGARDFPYPCVSNMVSYRTQTLGAGESASQPFTPPAYATAGRYQASADFDIHGEDLSQDDSVQVGPLTVNVQ